MHGPWFSPELKTGDLGTTLMQWFTRVACEPAGGWPPENPRDTLTIESDRKEFSKRNMENPKATLGRVSSRGLLPQISRYYEWSGVEILDFLSSSKPPCFKFCQIIFRCYLNTTVKFLERESCLSKSRNLFSGWYCIWWTNICGCWTRSSQIEWTHSHKVYRGIRVLLSTLSLKFGT